MTIQKEMSLHVYVFCFIAMFMSSFYIQNFDKSKKITFVCKYDVYYYTKAQGHHIDYSHGTSAHAQKGCGLHEEVLKMLNCGTVSHYWSIFHTKSDTF